MCYDESNNILSMMTTFKKINPRNKLGISTHSRYDYKSTNDNYKKISINPSRGGKTINFPTREDKYNLLYL